MKYLYKLRDWAYKRFDSWLTTVGTENCPMPNEYDHLPDDLQLFTSSDRMGDEKG